MTWVLVQAPKFPDAGPSQVPLAHAVDPAQPNVLYLTNGTSLGRSEDGGCTWTFPYQVPTTPTAAGLIDQTVGPLLPGKPPRAFEATITHIAAGGGLVYVAVLARPAGATVPLAAVSADGGHSFRQSSFGLPASGHPLDLEVSRTDPAAAWMLLAGGQIVGTDNGGGAWQSRAVLPVSGGLTAGNGQELWAYGATGTDNQGATGLYRSTDGGRGVRTGARLRARRGRGRHRRRTCGRVPPRRRRVPLGRQRHIVPAVRAHRRHPASAGHGVGEQIVAVTTAGVELSEAGMWFDATPAGADSLADVRVTATSPARMVVRTGSGLAAGPFPVAVPRPAVPEGPLVRPLRRPPPGAARFQPDGLPITVAPGSQAVVDIGLELPYRVRPVDLFVLADITSSMDPFINGLRRSLDAAVSGLASGGADVRVGLGAFIDYPIQPYGRGEDFPYKLLRRIGPADQELRDRVEVLFTQGTGDLPESQLAALYQAATGAGQSNALPGSPTYIAPGQDAGFRAGALRVIVLGTDARFHRAEREPVYPGPSTGQTVAALRERGVRVVGVRLSSDARADLDQVASDTGAVAGVDVDCDGNGRADIVPGQPLVCPLARERREPRHRHRRRDHCDRRPR